MNQKPKVFKSILTAILGALVFGGVFFLTALIVGGIIYLLTQIPVIGGLIEWLFYMRGDSPDLLIALLAPQLAYAAAKSVLSKINKDAPTLGLSCEIAGISIAAVHILSLVANLLAGDSVLFNIAQGIAGVVLFFFGKNTISESSNSEE